MKVSDAIKLLVVLIIIVLLFYLLYSNWEVFALIGMIVGIAAVILNIKEFFKP
jgi:hypothetical protein